jgi:hypothetical protein
LATVVSHVFLAVPDDCLLARRLRARFGLQARAAVALPLRALPRLALHVIAPFPGLSRRAEFRAGVLLATRLERLLLAGAGQILPARPGP